MQTKAFNVRLKANRNLGPAHRYDKDTLNESCAPCSEAPAKSTNACSHWKIASRPSPPYPSKWLRSAAAKDSLLSTRACAACRTLKIRCIIETAAGRKRCQRCAMLDRDCIFPAPKKRKRRKRNDGHVTLPEDKSSSMKDDGGAVESSRPQREQTNSILPAISGNIYSPIVTNRDPVQTYSQNTIRGRQSDPLDHLDLGSLTTAVAEELYSIFNHDLINQFPVVSFLQSYSIESLRAEKPTLFLAIMAAAAINLQPQLSSTLNRQVLQMCLTRVSVKSEKSLELVQAMLITIVWNSSRDNSNFGRYEFCDYIQMVATMALELRRGSNLLEAEALDQECSRDLSATSNGAQKAKPPSILQREKESHAVQKPDAQEIDNEK